MIWRKAEVGCDWWLPGWGRHPDIFARKQANGRWHVQFGHLQHGLSAEGKNRNEAAKELLDSYRRLKAVLDSYRRLKAVLDSYRRLKAVLDANRAKTT